MPELPEVETVVSDLKEKIVGKKIIEVWSDWPKMIKNISFPELQKKLIDQKIEQVARRGKNILIQVGRSVTLVLHLKMTGHLLFRSQKFFPLDLDKLNKKEKGSPFAQKVNQYIHFRFLFEKGKELAFSDMRKFGRIRFFQQPLAETLKNDDFKVLNRNHIVTLSSFAFPVICRTPELREFYLKQFSGAGIEIRPMIAGNIQKQPFYDKYIKKTYDLKGSDLMLL